MMNVNVGRWVDLEVESRLNCMSRSIFVYLSGANTKVGIIYNGSLHDKNVSPKHPNLYIDITLLLQKFKVFIKKTDGVCYFVLIHQS